MSEERVRTEVPVPVRLLDYDPCAHCDDRPWSCTSTPGECYDRLPPEAKAEPAPYTLADRVRELHGARVAADRVKLEHAKRQFELLGDPTLIRLTQQLKEATDWLNTCDAELRSSALAEYEATKSKQPAAGVSIKVMTDIEIDKAQALTWAKCFAPVFVIETIDEKGIKAFVKANPERNLAYAKVTSRAVVTVATDLSAAVADSEATE